MIVFFANGEIKLYWTSCLRGIHRLLSFAHQKKEEPFFHCVELSIAKTNWEHVVVVVVVVAFCDDALLSYCKWNWCFYTHNTKHHSEIGVPKNRSIFKKEQRKKKWNERINFNATVFFWVFFLFAKLRPCHIKCLGYLFRSGFDGLSSFIFIV